MFSSCLSVCLSFSGCLAVCVFGFPAVWLSVCLSVSLSPPSGGGLRNHEISQQFIANHIISLATHSKTTWKWINWSRSLLITFSLRHTHKINTIKYTAIIKMKLVNHFREFCEGDYIRCMR